MIYIAICDDEEYVHHQITKLLQTYADMTEVQIFCFSSGSELLEKAKVIPFDLIYLDIVMPEQDGLTTAQLLREQECSAAIIFLTSYDDYLESGYEVQAFRYRFKPLDEEVFKSDLHAWRQGYYVQHGQMVWIPTLSGVHRVPVADIIYLEIVARRVKIVTVKETLISTESMQYWEAKLQNANFLSPYNKILVNELHVKYYDAGKVITTGDYELPMSRRKYTQFCEMMMRP